MPKALPQQQQCPRGPANDLHRAAYDGSIKRTVALLSSGSLDVNQGTPHGYTALMLGAANGHADIVRILLSKGADASILGYDGFAALHLAAQDGHVTVAGVLLEGGADINLRAHNSNGGTALLMASQKGHLDVIAMLIDAGADLRETTTKGSSPLHMAAEYGHLDAIAALVKAGGDPRAQTSEGVTPLHLAAQNGHLEIMVTLVNAGGDPRATNYSTGHAPLHLAAQNGHAEVVSALAKAGADVRATESSTFTPLHFAAQNGHLESARALVEAGADVRAPAKLAYTPLHLAAQNGHLETAIALVKAGADLEAVTSDEGFTPLHSAATKGHSEVVQALIDEGANPNAPLPDGSTPLFVAAAGGHVEVTRALLRAKADPLLAVMIGPPGRTRLSVPLDLAAISGHAEVVRELVRQVGIEGCGGESGGEQALGLAASAEESEVVAVLAEAGAVDTGDALIFVAGTGHEAAVKALLHQQEERGSTGGAAYVNSCDGVGRTALFKAICRCSPRVVRLLVDAGADTTSTVPITLGAWVSSKTPLNIVTHMIRSKDVAGEVATEEQLHRLECIRRVLLRVVAVRAKSWLWHRDVPIVGRASSGRTKISSTPLRMMLPALRRRAGRRVVLLGARSGGSGAGGPGVHYVGL